MEAHFTTDCSFGSDHHKYQLKTNFWWCIEINARRFGYDDQLKQILINTAKLFDES